MKSLIESSKNVLIGITEDYKVGDIVKPNIGPHKNHPHVIIHDHGDGKFNIKPKSLLPKNIKYKHGAVTVTKDQIEK